jgi:AcrR family transcriptional regulator
MSSDRSTTTRERLAEAALALFEANGYEHTTVNDIAAACGVSHMTFFRYFPKKESVLLDDPYDPAIARAVAEQPASLPVIERVARGLLLVTEAMGDAVGPDARRRVAVATRVPELRAGIVENTRATEDAIVAACTADGSDPLEVRVAAAACLAALSTALMQWATGEPGAALGEVVRTALATVVPRLGDES